ncbi:hypothetical protein, partial [Vibrio chemaguriensis]|uniref:hypothetical protein n=1 Tax=Vibrio chemaguriensis TaxID=2527672 RepID=UPI001CDD02A4
RKPRGKVAGGSETGRAGAFHCEGKPSSDHRSSKAWDLAELDGPNPYWEGVAYVFQLHGPPV